MERLVGSCRAGLLERALMVKRGPTGEKRSVSTKSGQAALHSALDCRAPAEAVAQHQVPLRRLTS